jgi:UDP-N-acetylmuramoyl-L-alanyl-D-glutamate--2,6-diaminopimelate ligase
MGEVATRVADLTIVTSDNPRSEDPEAIVREIEPGAKRGGGAYELIVDRTDAIREAVRQARGGDVVLVAGKGHEQGQHFADRTIPYDDRIVVREAIEEITCRS